MTSVYKRIWKLVIANLLICEKLYLGINYQNSSVKRCNDYMVWQTKEEFFLSVFSITN